MKSRSVTKLVLIGLLVFCLSAILVLSACARPESAPGGTGKKMPDSIVVLTSTAGASGYVMTVAFSQFAEQELGMKVTVVEEGASVARVKMLNKKEAELINTVGYSVVEQAWQGTEAFTGMGRQPIRMIMSEYVGAMPIISLKRTGIQSAKDLKGKRVMYVKEGAEYYENLVRYLLEYNGMTLNDIKAVEFSNPKDVEVALKAGTIDVGLRTSGAKGSAAMVEMSRTLDINILSLTDAEVKHIISKQPAFVNVVTKAGVYKGNGELNLVAYPLFTLVHKDMSDDFVYAICKLMMDSCGLDTTGRFEQIHPDRDYTLRTACPSPRLAPYHPGAVKYYKERGAWTDEHEQLQKKMLAS